jgi:predicted aconitase
MAELCQGRLKHPDVTVVVTSGPQVLDLAMFGAGVAHGPYGMLPAPTPNSFGFGRLGRHAGIEVLAESRSLGFGEQLEAFGAQLVSDTCWCMLGEVGSSVVFLDI